MTAPILATTSTEHRRHSIPPMRHNSMRADVAMSQLARDFYTQSRATNEMFDRLSQENSRVIALIEECDQRISALGARVRHLESMVFEPFNK